MRITLRRLNPPVSFEDGVMFLGDQRFTHDEWVQWTGRINRQWNRIYPPAPNKPEPQPVGSPFIVRNLSALNKVSRGRVKPAPFWLRWLYDHVITKERLEPSF